MIIKEITWTEKLFYFIWIWVNIIKTSFCITVFFLFKLISNSLLKRGLDEKLHKYITNLKVILIYTNAKYTQRINTTKIYTNSYVMISNSKTNQIRVKDMHIKTVIHITIEKTDQNHNTKNIEKWHRLLKIIYVLSKIMAVTSVVEYWIHCINPNLRFYFRVNFFWNIRLHIH